MREFRMNRNHPRSAAAGFTLIELMITVAIVGVLAAIAYPSYTQYVRKSNRTDATRTMMQGAQALQRCYSATYAYTGCAAATSGTSPGGWYTVTVTPTATSYTIIATPLGVQVKDTACASFTLLSSGQQSALNSGGADATKTCWGSTS
jgi:type IV pilus assembly protein PilE